MALSELEAAWRAWLALNEHDRQQFLNRFREAHRQERQERLLANGGRAEPVSAEPFNGLVVAALDFGFRSDEAA
jgi:hypothetical protein